SPTLCHPDRNFPFLKGRESAVEGPAVEPIYVGDVCEGIRKRARLQPCRKSPFTTERALASKEHSGNIRVDLPIPVPKEVSLPSFECRSTMLMVHSLERAPHPSRDLASSLARCFVVPPATSEARDP